MDIARLLTQAAGSWLHFEYCCNRSGLFNEKYLSVPIGQLLSSRFGDRVHAEFLHPVISPMMKGPGRRPQIDFAYCETYPNVSIAVETKWIGATKPKISDILWDLVRLEMIAHHSNAQCVFMLGGRRKDLHD